MFTQILNMIYVTLVRICQTDYVLLLLSALSCFGLYGVIVIIWQLVTLYKR